MRTRDSPRGHERPKLSLCTPPGRNFTKTNRSKQAPSRRHLERGHRARESRNVPPGWALLHFRRKFLPVRCPGNKRLAPSDGAVTRYGTCALPGSYRMPYTFHSVKIMGEVM